MRTLLLPLALMVPSLAAAQTPTFDPIAFFTGATHGTGRLKAGLKPGEEVDVRGTGRVERDGTLVLRQTVERQGRDPERREWRIRQTGPGRYTGTLSSATGPVEGRTEKGRLKLTYKMKGGLHATQWIEAAPDSQSARNRMTVRRLGVPVATLDETIRRSAY